MPTTLFPTGAFGFLDKEVDIERQTLSGGVALSGDEDIVGADGGGRVFADFGGGALVDRDKVLLWRALTAYLEGGVTAVVVPFCDPRHSPYGGEHRVPHSDGSLFSDDSPYVGGGSSAVTTSAAALRATSLELEVSSVRPLVGGEWFSIEHPNKGWRAYRIVAIAGDVVKFRPPLREAVDAGTPVELAEPRCLMRQRRDTRASTALVYGRKTEAAIRFVEAP